MKVAESNLPTPVRIIGLGNSMLTDDGVGIYTVREVGSRLAASGIYRSVDIVESEVGGFALMELMEGWERIILVDSIRFDGLESGAVIRIEPEDLHTSLRVRSVHEIDLPTAVNLGRRIGLRMPRDITIFGIQVEDPYTFSECLTPAAQRGMQKAADFIIRELSREESKLVQSKPPVLVEVRIGGG